MKVKEAIDLINSSDELYCISDAVDLLRNETLLQDGIDSDRHRWYEVSESYYQLEDGILGIRGVSDVFSEMMSTPDCDVHTQAFEGEEICTVSYRKKK